MRIDNQKAKRLVIYFLRDKSGIVDAYVIHFLNDLARNAAEFCIICPENIQEQEKEKLQRYGQIVCSNIDHNQKAYKEGLEHIGWGKVKEFDEIVLLDSTVMGPVFPLKTTFEKMSGKEVDFWSVTKCFGMAVHNVEKDMDYIDPCFVVCRKSMTISCDFREYWFALEKEKKTVSDSIVEKGSFTKYFSSRGFEYDSAVEMEEFRKLTKDPLRMCPRKLIEGKGCPVFYLDSFTFPPDTFLRNTSGEQSSELYSYLKEESEYDENLIWDKILREEHQYDIVKNLNLVFPLSREMKMRRTSEKEQKTVLVMHLYFEDLLEESLGYAKAMPKNCDLYITTDSEKKKQAIRNKFQGMECSKIEIRVIQNRGRDVSSLLTGVKDVIMDYDLACFVHDKKTTQLKPGTVGASFGRKCLENTLSGRTYVENIIQTFQENPRLGILSPPEPNHSVYFATLGGEWGPNYEVTTALARRLGLTVPLAVEKPPVGPMGTMFWFRPKAMEPLYRQDWDYKDFPPEPNKPDGTLLHAIERIYPYAVQQSGYYPGIVMTDEYMAVEYSNLRYYTREYNKVMLKLGIGPYQNEICEELDGRLDSFLSIRNLLKILCRRIFHNLLF